jgi:hypothetical protein
MLNKSTGEYDIFARFAAVGYQTAQGSRCRPTSRRRNERAAQQKTPSGRDGGL